MSLQSDDVNGDQPEGAGPRAGESMAGLAKGLAIIEGFGPDNPRLTVADAARISGTTRAAARRCLLTLAELGYVEYDGKFYKPRPRMLRLGLHYLEATPLPQLAAPLLANLRDTVEESASLAVREGDRAIFVARAEARRVVSTGVRVGAELPLHISAAGRVLLGALPEAARRAYFEGATLEARTPKTLIDLNALIEAVDVARNTGIAVTDEELELGMRVIAVPVVDGQGNVVAAMSLSASSARVSVADMLDDMAPALRDAASRLSRHL